MNAATPPYPVRPQAAAWIGIGSASAIILAWGAHLAWLLTQPTFLTWWAPLAIAVQTFLHTGMFIVAHDAMHGSVAPGWSKVNRFFGQLALLLYALFSFEGLRRAHVEHHRAPGTAADPDHTGGQPLGYFGWYFRFMFQYLKWYQIAGMATLFNVANHVFDRPASVLIMFWVVPSLLSTFQLFTFGTYLPHRIPPGGHRDRHAAQTNNWPSWLSFVTCYHFGYHWEHHEYPAVPWWRLPKFRRGRTKFEPAL